MKDFDMRELANAFFGARKPEALQPSYALEIVREDNIRTKYRLPYKYSSLENRKVAAEIFSSLGDDINLVLQDLGYAPHLFAGEALTEGSWRIGFCS